MDFQIEIISPDISYFGELDTIIFNRIESMMGIKFYWFELNQKFFPFAKDQLILFENIFFLTTKRPYPYKKSQGCQDRKLLSY